MNSNRKNKMLNNFKSTNQMKIDNKIIQQEMKFKYLRINMSSYRGIEDEVRSQATKVIRTAVCVNNVAQRKKYMGIEAKSLFLHLLFLYASLPVLSFNEPPVYCHSSVFVAFPLNAFQLESNFTLFSPHDLLPFCSYDPLFYSFSPFH